MLHGSGKRPSSTAQVPCILEHQNFTRTMTNSREVELQSILMEAFAYTALYLFLQNHLN